MSLLSQIEYSIGINSQKHQAYQRLKSRLEGIACHKVRLRGLNAELYQSAQADFVACNAFQPRLQSLALMISYKNDEHQHPTIHARLTHTQARDKMQRASMFFVHLSLHDSSHSSVAASHTLDC